MLMDLWWGRSWIWSDLWWGIKRGVRNLFYGPETVEEERQRLNNELLDKLERDIKRWS